MIDKEKTIPILDEYKISQLAGEILFDEEIIIFDDDIYIDNRLRITIEKNKFGINIHSVNYQKEWGLGYSVITFTDEEFEKFSSIDDLINEVFILGNYEERGFSVATGIMKNDPIEEEFSY